MLDKALELVDDVAFWKRRATAWKRVARVLFRQRRLSLETVARAIALGELTTRDVYERQLLQTEFASFYREHETRFVEMAKVLVSSQSLLKLAGSEGQSHGNGARKV